MTLFNERDREEIIRVPLSPNPSDDVRVWPHEKNGKFFVRSAYHMGMNFMLGGRGDIPSTSSGAKGSLYTKLWASQELPKVKLLG